MNIEDMIVTSNYKPQNVQLIRIHPEEKNSIVYKASLDMCVVDDSQWKTDFNCITDDIIDTIKKNANIQILHPSKTPYVANLICKILQYANTVAVLTHRGCANYMIYNSAFESILNNTPLSKELPNTFGIENNKFFTKKDNELFLISSIKCLKTELHEAKPTCIIGYKGAAKGDGGICLVKDEENNRYAVVDTIHNTKDYYYMIQIETSEEY